MNAAIPQRWSSKQNLAYDLDSIRVRLQRAENKSGISEEKDGIVLQERTVMANR